MPHVITSGCCSDASCVSVCPVDCIHPTPDEPDFGTTATLFVDPRSCIDCGACVDACPVDAIAPADTLGPAQQVFTIRNREFYESLIGQARRQQQGRGSTVDVPERAPTPLRFPAAPAPGQPRLDVVVVGTGPAAHYTADLLLRVAGAEVTMIDRLPATGGLLRHGVAPDHPATRRLGERFTGFLHNPRLHLLLGVEVGRDVSVDELARHADAVVLAVGAADGRQLEVPGETLPGVVTSTEFVHWYNGHPDRATTPDLVGERAVVVGTGNVALDVARVLLTDPDALAATDIADDALDALRTSDIREVVVVGRRGPDAAACTPGELHDLQHVAGVDVVVADTPGVREQLESAAPGSPASWFADLPVVAVDPATPAAGRRVVFWFGAQPAAFDGDGRVGRVCLTRTADDGDATELAAGLAVTAIGHRGRPVPGVAFDETTHTVPHREGRVLSARDGDPVPGRYVVGWIKRGASGGIGANRADAAETVAALLADASAGVLPERRGSGRSLRRRLRRQLPGVVDREGWRAIDRAEREAGAAAGRPRVRFTTTAELRSAATRR